MIRFSEEDLRSAVNEACECGGEGPGNGCAACEVWHLLMSDRATVAATLETARRRAETAEREAARWHARAAELRAEQERAK